MSWFQFWQQDCGCTFALLGVVKLGEKWMNKSRLSAAFRLLSGFHGVCCVI